MCIPLLLRQLRLEFGRDVDYDAETARSDVGELWQAWRIGVGRHSQESASDKFCQWWTAHYERCLIKEGSRATYHEFIRDLVTYASRQR